MEILEGIVDHITYRNDENFYTVAQIDTSSEHRSTIVGYFPAIQPGQSVRLEGEWVTHPDYGVQFKVSSFQVVAPATRVGIQRYLGSGMIKGIGPVTAERLVETFGLETLNVIENEPERLAQVEGIGPKKSQAIAQAFAEQEDIRNVMVFLQGHGVTPALAVRIYREYGNDAIPLIQANPYRLAEEVFGIGFKTADTIAKKLGVIAESPDRAAAAIVYLLNRGLAEGHVFLTLVQLQERVEAIDVSPYMVEPAVQALLEGRRIVLEATGADAGDEESAVYLAPHYYAEKGVGTELVRLLQSGSEAVGENGGGAAGDDPSLFPTDPGAEVRRLERQQGIELAAAQREAVVTVLARPVFILTGGPGTGKTTVVRSMLTVMEDRGWKIGLAAPTGRAARRMKEATGREARTLHRLLEFGYDESKGLSFQRNQDNPLDYDVIIVDEASMIDVMLMFHLLRALRNGTRLILVGDVDQLPSVGPGNVLKDLIATGYIPVVRLTEIFRQARESLIVVNAHRIQQGRSPIVNRRAGDFFFMDEKEVDGVADRVIELVATRLPDYLGQAPVEGVQVLTPIRRTAIGVDSLNRRLQEALNPARKGADQVQIGQNVFRAGDKVMQIRNNYGKMVFNGDIGRIVTVDSEFRTLTVEFPDEEGSRRLEYEESDLEELVLSYATSVHKSQGSEYPAIVMPVTWVMPALMTRNLLYTAMTRAQKLVVLVGQRPALEAYIHNDKSDDRNTRLDLRVRELMQGGV